MESKKFHEDTQDMGVFHVGVFQKHRPPSQDILQTRLVLFLKIGLMQYVAVKTDLIG